MEFGELIKKIKKIEIKSDKIAEEIFTGDYRSAFRGKGMEFENIRRYMPGDDVRNIDWNVTARQNKVFVKQFCEEREMNIFLLIDMSKSNNFGKKKDFIAEISASLALSAARNNDRVGAVFFTGVIEKMIASKSGKKHVLSIIENILNFQPRQTGTNLAGALDYFNRIEKKRSVVFLISDFLDDGYMNELKISASRHDLILIRVADRAEDHIPAGAVFTFEDLETSENWVLDNLKGSFKTNPPAGCSKKNLVTVYTDEDYAKLLRQFFKRRRIG